ncbi:MAG: hypothetical protein ACLPPV_15765 [Candidatus Korobacteraceae bacterium]
MAGEIASLMGEIEPDPWRAEVGFSPEVQAALDITLESPSDANLISTLNEWIAKYQPCLFGRIAAKTSSLSYCFVREEMPSAITQNRPLIIT